MKPSVPRIRCQPPTSVRGTHRFFPIARGTAGPGQQFACPRGSRKSNPADPLPLTSAPSLGWDGGPGVSRTRDLRFRKPLLYPSELRGRMFVCLSLHSAACPLTVQRPYMRRKPDLVSASHRAFSHAEPGCRSAQAAFWFVLTLGWPSNSCLSLSICAAVSFRCSAHSWPWRGRNPPYSSSRRRASASMSVIFART